MHNNGTCSKHDWTGSGTTQATCSDTWMPDNHNTWNGCVVDRGNSNGPVSGAYDTNVVAPTTGNQSHAVLRRAVFAPVRRPRWD